MKLTHELKEKLEAAKTAEEKKKLLVEAGIELTDEEIEMVAGGEKIGKDQIGEHELTLERTTYHIGFRRKPVWEEKD